jgi:hypothetical protein
VTFTAGVVQVKPVAFELKGERYRLIIKKTVGANLTYNSSTSVTLSEGGTKASFSYDYTSDVVPGTLKLKAAIPVANSGDSINFYEGQISCLENKQANIRGGCNASALGIKPRHFTIVHRVAIENGGEIKYGAVEREARVSTRSGLIQCAQNISTISLCLRYQGESIKHLENLI